jgi:hypothetical protein
MIGTPLVVGSLEAGEINNKNTEDLVFNWGCDQ